MKKIRKNLNLDEALIKIFSKELIIYFPKLWQSSLRVLSLLLSFRLYLHFRPDW